jgi:MFS transporter, DHA3 family, macrolide efflux protein
MKKNSMPMQIFIFIWIGQVVSLLGSSLTSFALGIWVYQHTKSVTLYALVLLSSALPPILFSPVIGALVDRWPRRWAMILSDSGAGLGALLLTLLLVAGKLEVWNVSVILAISSIFAAFQQPAYSAAITLLVPKESLDRANGMLQVGSAVSHIIAPVLGGVLLVTIKLEGVILLDFATFLFALIPLLLVKFPEAEIVPAKRDKEISLLREAADGWTYIADRPGFLGLLIFLAISNFLVGVVVMLFTPLILSFSSPATLGIITSIGGFGALLSSVLMSIRGAPKQLILGVFSFEILSGLCILIVGGFNSIPLITAAVFLFFIGSPIVSTCVQTIFQRKVAKDLQGRVFAMCQMVTGLSFPLALIIAGPLIDRVFEPLMASNGFLAGSIGQIIGTGPGRGIGLMFIIMGAFTLLATIAAYQYPRLRLIEDEIPDAI